MSMWALVLHFLMVVMLDDAELDEVEEIEEL
jgi:hypothetical protein